MSEVHEKYNPYQEKYNKYKERINEYFLHKAGGGLILSPKNWLVIDKWEKMDIPLHIVIQGIDKTFENLASVDQKKKKIHQLAYCEPEILNLWRIYQKKEDAGLSDQAVTYEQREEDQKRIREYVINKISFLIKELLKRLAEEVDIQGLTKAVEDLGLVDKLKNLYLEVEKDFRINIEVIEKRLQDLDEELIQGLPLYLQPQVIESLNMIVEKKMRPYKKQMESMAYQETVQAHFNDLLRKEFSLHRLSLY